MSATWYFFSLLQQVLSAQQALDGAARQQGLQSPGVDAWIQDLAKKQGISKEEAQSKVQAIRYTLELEDDATAFEDLELEDDATAFEDPIEDQPLERRDVKDYPLVLRSEEHNDDATNLRILEQHFKCRDSCDPPPQSPHTPSEGHSFWRAAGGQCYGASTIRIVCRLPDEFGPPRWEETNGSNRRIRNLRCPDNYVCTLFQAHYFLSDRIVQWGGCVLEESTSSSSVDPKTKIPEYIGIFRVPMSPGTQSELSIYADTIDQASVEWAFWSGVHKTTIEYTSGNAFLASKMDVARVGYREGEGPFLKFSREGKPATIDLWYLLFSA